MKILQACVLLSLGGLLAACAGGPKLSESNVPSIPQDQGRIYFYRTQVIGVAVQPSIRLNGNKVGDCQPNGVFFKDVAPGDYEATVTTEVEHKLTFTIAKSEEKYVRCYITFGLFVGHAVLELVDPEEARGKIAGLSLTAGAP